MKRLIKAFAFSKEVEDYIAYCLRDWINDDDSMYYEYAIENVYCRIKDASINEYTGELRLPENIEIIYDEEEAKQLFFDNVLKEIKENMEDFYVYKIIDNDYLMDKFNIKKDMQEYILNPENKDKIMEFTYYVLMNNVKNKYKLDYDFEHDLAMYILDNL